MEVTWLVMRAHSPGLQPLSVIQQDLLFPFCPDCIWAVGQVAIPWHIGTPLSVLGFLKTSVVLGVMAREGCPDSASCPRGWLDGSFCGGFAAVQRLQSQPLPVPSDQRFPSVCLWRWFLLHLKNMAFEGNPFCGPNSSSWPSSKFMTDN